jgi:hypothetical protein
MAEIKCPVCAGPLVPLRSQFVRICNDCKAEFAWNLDPGQQPLLGSSRAGRKRPDE